MKYRQGLLWIVFWSVTVFTPMSSAQQDHRITLSLNGQWEVEDSVGADELPKTYTHKVPVPGLTHSATPQFPDVDQYQSQQLLSNLVRQGLFSQADYDKLGDVRGVSHQKRNYFWYHRSFQGPAKKTVALLKVNKAQFSTVVYLNGVLIGGHDPCFTAAFFDLTKAVRWNATNELVIRIGAHPGVLPPTVSQGTDFEKNRWTPGIYDDVSLLAMDNPVITNVQVAPQLATSSILVQTELHNYSDHVVTTEVDHQISEWKSHASASKKLGMQVELPPGATREVTQTVALVRPHLWSPEDPFLYQVSTGTTGDATTTRFGMREFRFDTVTQRAYLNGRPYFLRGSNITLHRFFEDPEVGTFPWDGAWLHRLLVDIPKQMHWNAFRFCIGPVPDRWLDIADENGLLIQYEYMVWTGHPSWSSWQPHYDQRQMITEYTEWMRDNWNHPSVAIWDATNESFLPEFTKTIVPAVRLLDLSNRPWENSYNAPVGGDDPVEDHQYLFQDLAMSKPGDKAHVFQVTDIEDMLGPGSSSVTSKTAHALILNEYGWLWLNRDGSPTLLTDKLYPKLLGDRDTTASRFALQAYLLGGETEFWRAYRRYAGVLHFVYLTSSDPRAFTADHFLDLKTLKLNPYFEREMEQAFKPLGVYLNFWQPTIRAGETRDYTIAMVNDEDRTRAGKLRLSFMDAKGKETDFDEISFGLSSLGAQSYTVSLKAPAASGEYSLRAVAAPADDSSDTTVSHRNVRVEESQAVK